MHGRLPTSFLPDSDQHFTPQSPPVAPPCLPSCRKSQIQTFLEQNEGPGLQHVALKTDDICATMRQMRAR